MKKKLLWSLGAAAFILAALAMLFVYISMREKLYYAQENHYVLAEGTVGYIAFQEDRSELTVGLSDLSPAFEGDGFRLVGDALSLARSRGLDEKLQVGSRVRFITAPKTFGANAVPPIVALSVNGESLLDYTEGYPALIAWLDAG